MMDEKIEGDPESETGLKSSGHVVIGLSRLLTLGIKALIFIVILAPLVGLALNSGPPWPTRTGVCIFTSLANLLVFFYVFTFKSKIIIQATSKRLIVCSAILMSLSFLAYMIISTGYIYIDSIRTGSDGIIGGFVLTAEGREMVAQSGSVTEALNKYGYAAVSTVMWEPWSINAVKYTLLASWFIGFISLSIFIGMLVIASPSYTSDPLFSIHSISLQRAEIERLHERADKEPEKIKPAWDLAKARLELYFDRNLSQINYIFWLSVIVMAVGFCFILYGIRNTFASTQSNFITPAVISGLAGVITEFIGATFLFLYRSTIQQAASYTQTLERINSVGMAMQILDTISSDSKELQDKTKAEIVKILLLHSVGVSTHEIDSAVSSNKESDKSK